MKKILSLTLAIIMAFSVIPTAFALGTMVLCPEHGDNPGTSGSCGHPVCTECGWCLECGDSVGGDENPENDIPEVGTTTVTLVGTEEAAGAYYEVTVPAAMAPGDNADVTVEGNWNSAQTLKVTAPEKVTLYNGDQSIDVAITFTGINAAGNDLADCSATANLKLADASVKFGTWTGVIEYNVELIN